MMREPERSTTISFLKKSFWKLPSHLQITAKWILFRKTFKEKVLRKKKHKRKSRPFHVFFAWISIMVRPRAIRLSNIDWQFMPALELIITVLCQKKCDVEGFRFFLGFFKFRQPKPKFLLTFSRWFFHLAHFIWMAWHHSQNAKLASLSYT